MNDTCKSCGIEWVEHPGAEPLCRDLRSAKTALQEAAMTVAKLESEVYRLNCAVSELKLEADYQRAERKKWKQRAEELLKGTKV